MSEINYQALLLELRITGQPYVVCTDCGHIQVRPTKSAIVQNLSMFGNGKYTSCYLNHIKKQQNGIDPSSSIQYRHRYDWPEHEKDPKTGMQRR